jgi:anti-sigma regulatory factor (Ser/Thr protein kinase)
LALPENAEKKAFVTFERNDNELRFVVKDQGNGFDWHKYLEMSPERVFDNHGRGIAMAKTISFDRIDYQGNGNEVHATTFLK